ncbi:MAG TPA: DinB family protein [Pyrinomonadaceae bacterium]|nr:DinB family protein [Pyrinomonadaceae bacterium]
MEFQLDKAKEVLRRTPATLNALLGELPNDWVLSNEGPDTWSPYDVIGHLIEGEETDWIPRARIILEQGEARPFDRFDRFAMFEKSKGKSLVELLATFAQMRSESLRQLDELNLTPELLQKRGTHPVLGAVTLSQLLSAWVVHDLGHIRQIVRVMAKQYGDAVGPWTAFLTILDDKPAA